jgi:hypothetical protein
MENRPNNADITSGTTLNKDKFLHYLSSLSIGPTKNFKQKPVTTKEIKDIIKSLKNKNSWLRQNINENTEIEYALHNIAPYLYM